MVEPQTNVRQALRVGAVEIAHRPFEAYGGGMVAADRGISSILALKRNDASGVPTAVDHGGPHAAGVEPQRREVLAAGGAPLRQRAPFLAIHIDAHVAVRLRARSCRQIGNLQCRALDHLSSSAARSNQLTRSFGR